MYFLYLAVNVRCGIKKCPLNVLWCSFIGEESVAAGEACVLTDSPTWIIDPVDGTTNFVHAYAFLTGSHSKHCLNIVYTGNTYR